MNWAQTHSYLQINPQRRSKREAPPPPGDGGAENDHCCCSCWCSSRTFLPTKQSGAREMVPPERRETPGVFFAVRNTRPGGSGPRSEGELACGGARPLYLLAHSRIGW